MKNQVDSIEAIPSKRIYSSIIADYDINRAICELVDNGLDIWVKNGKDRPLDIQINLDKDRQTIDIIDNAGGVKKENIQTVVGPGHTSNEPTDEIIGIFGVGTKRAVVALAQDIKITTRHGRGRTYRVEIDDNWLRDDDWNLPLYEVNEISEDTTHIELQRLRVTITDDVISNLKSYLEATYAKFISDNQITINLNSERLGPINFENWAYPPDYPPHRYYGDLTTEEGKKIHVEVLAGLTKESSPAGGEYGVYFYCNDRLIGRALKDYHVGFIRGLAGQPHPSVSLVRVIVSLKGEAQLMPWNSSKSGINHNHNVFTSLRNWLVIIVKDYASLSRRLEGDWQNSVFKYPTGTIVEKKIGNFPKAKKSFLPPLPKSKLRYIDKIKQSNQNIVQNKPWTKGLYEGIVSVDIISKQKLEQKNRINLVLLDSTLEIGFKEFLVNESGQTYNDARLLTLFKNRTDVQKEVKKYVNIDNTLWGKINYYYNLRCKLIHERASVTISDEDMEDYRKVVQKVLRQMFRLRFNA